MRRYRATFEAPPLHLDWDFDALNWIDAIKKTNDKMKAVNMPLTCIEWLKIDPINEENEGKE